VIEWVIMHKHTGELSILNRWCSPLSLASFWGGDMEWEILGKL